MATAATHPLAHFVRRVAGSPLAALPDGELLERFAADRDEAAFAVLVRRHGPMVLGLCRRILGDHHAAEDAFQASFLVLARKADSLRRPELVGNWLYGVACRTARKARGRASRRAACERRAATVEARQPDEPLWRDLRPLLDEAVARLPAKYRGPVVLCYLEGRTVAEAAAQLGCPRGTIATRLAWARQRLRQRLSRRGLSLSAAALTAVLSERAAPACVPAPLVTSTTRVAGTVFAQGGKLMLMTQGKVAALVLALAVAAGGAAQFGQRIPAAEQPATKESRPPARASASEKERLLFLEGSTRFLLGDYAAADRAFARLCESRPNSRLVPPAAELAILAKHLTTGDAAERKLKVAEGRRLIKKALAGIAERAEGPARRVPAPPREQAHKLFQVAEFYRKAGHHGSARFYYELICRRHPKSAFATRAEAQLREQPPVLPRPSPRVGQLFIVGNTRTEQDIILKHVRLYPGAELKYPDLQETERNLRKLGIFVNDPVKGIRPTVTVIDPNDDSPYKDILIQVKEKK